MKAAITADIVNSTSLSAVKYKQLINSIRELFKGDDLEVYRGDSFQVLVYNAEEALYKSLQARLAAINCSNQKRIDIRMSISLGEPKSVDKSIGSNMDELFVRSGRYFDNFKNSTRRLYIASGNDSIDFTFEIIAEYIDSLMETVTPKQAEVLSYMFEGKSQVEIAKVLNKTTATINQHVKTSRYTEFESMLSKFKILTNQL